MKRVLMIGTGGTIASEMTGAGLVPELTTDQFLKYVPAVRDVYKRQTRSRTSRSRITIWISRLT